MHIKAMTLAALLAACTTTQTQPEDPPKKTGPVEPVVSGDVPVGARIDAFGAT